MPPRPFAAGGDRQESAAPDPASVRCGRRRWHYGRRRSSASAPCPDHNPPAPKMRFAPFVRPREPVFGATSCLCGNKSKCHLSFSLHQQRTSLITTCILLHCKVFINCNII